MFFHMVASLWLCMVAVFHLVKIIQQPIRIFENNGLLDFTATMENKLHSTSTYHVKEHKNRIRKWCKSDLAFCKAMYREIKQ